MNHVDMLRIVVAADLPDVALVELSEGLSADISAEDLVRMFSLVEQATLERAAKVCDASAKAFAEGEQGEVGLRVSLWDGASKGAEVLAAQIRELKDSHE